MTLQPHANTNAFHPALQTDLQIPALQINAQPRRRTILLVEDEPFVREATRGILEHAGFEVLPAADAPEAMQVYDQRRRAIDLVMTDMVLPGRTGLELGEDLRQRSPELVILVTSGYNNPEYDTESPESHTYFLAKPYSRRTLLDKIEKILAALLQPLSQPVPKPVPEPVPGRATQAG
jgi:two-component system cell cycle sensor histidine kinase/response regulator CckA